MYLENQIIHTGIVTFHPIHSRAKLKINSIQLVISLVQHEKKLIKSGQMTIPLESIVDIDIRNISLISKSSLFEIGNELLRQSTYIFLKDAKVCVVDTYDSYRFTKCLQTAWYSTLCNSSSKLGSLITKPINNLTLQYYNETLTSLLEADNANNFLIILDEFSKELLIDMELKDIVFKSRELLLLCLNLIQQLKNDPEIQLWKYSIINESYIPILEKARIQSKEVSSNISGSFHEHSDLDHHNQQSITHSVNILSYDISKLTANNQSLNNSRCYPVIARLKCVHELLKLIAALWFNSDHVLSRMGSLSGSSPLDYTSWTSMLLADHFTSITKLMRCDDDVLEKDATHCFLYLMSLATTEQQTSSSKTSRLKNSNLEISGNEPRDSMEFYIGEGLSSILEDNDAVEAFSTSKVFESTIGKDSNGMDDNLTILTESDVFQLDSNEKGHPSSLHDDKNNGSLKLKTISKILSVNDPLASLPLVRQSIRDLQILILSEVTRAVMISKSLEISQMNPSDDPLGQQRQSEELHDVTHDRKKRSPRNNVTKVMERQNSLLRDSFENGSDVARDSLDRFSPKSRTNQNPHFESDSVTTPGKSFVARSPSPSPSSSFALCGRLSPAQYSLFVENLRKTVRTVGEIFMQDPNYEIFLKMLLQRISNMLSEILSSSHVKTVMQNNLGDDTKLRRYNRKKSRMLQSRRQSRNRSSESKEASTLQTVNSQSSLPAVSGSGFSLVDGNDKSESQGDTPLNPLNIRLPKLSNDSIPLIATSNNSLPAILGNGGLSTNRALPTDSLSITSIYQTPHPNSKGLNEFDLPRFLCIPPSPLVNAPPTMNSIDEVDKGDEVDDQMSTERSSIMSNIRPATTQSIQEHKSNHHQNNNNNHDDSGGGLPSSQSIDSADIFKDRKLLFPTEREEGKGMHPISEEINNRSEFGIFTQPLGRSLPPLAKLKPISSNNSRSNSLSSHHGSPSLGFSPLKSTLSSHYPHKGIVETSEVLPFNYFPAITQEVLLFHLTLLLKVFVSDKLSIRKLIKQDYRNYLTSIMGTFHSLCPTPDVQNSSVATIDDMYLYPDEIKKGGKTTIPVIHPKKSNDRKKGRGSLLQPSHRLLSMSSNNLQDQDSSTIIENAGNKNDRPSTADSILQNDMNATASGCVDSNPKEKKSLFKGKKLFDTLVNLFSTKSFQDMKEEKKKNDQQPVVVPKSSKESLLLENENDGVMKEQFTQALLENANKINIYHFGAPNYWMNQSPWILLLLAKRNMKEVLELLDLQIRIPKK